MTLTEAGLNYAAIYYLHSVSHRKAYIFNQNTFNASIRCKILNKTNHSIKA